MWHSSLTKSEANQIENVQKTAFKVILGPNYISYEVACTLLNTEPLELRRTQLCIKFAKKDIKKSNTLFIKKNSKQTQQEPNLKLLKNNNVEQADMKKVAFLIYQNC